MSDATTPTFGEYAASELRKAKINNAKSLQGAGLAKKLDKLFIAFTSVDTAPRAKQVIPPNSRDVAEYLEKIEYPIDAEEFCDHYEQKGWMIGKNKMKSWQSACNNWKRNKWGKLTKPAKTAEKRNYTQF